MEHSLLSFALSLSLWSQGGVAYFPLLPWQDCRLPWGVDSLSLFFLVLTALLVILCVLVSWGSVHFLVKEFLLCLLSVELLLFGVFTALDLLVFFVLFEALLVPMFLLIGVWGRRRERVRAAFYFFFFTFSGSVLLLLSILSIYRFAGTTDFLVLRCLEFSADLQLLLFVGFFLSFAVKVPMVPFHVWLPQAHVEAPTAGSVLLAGLLLKLGGYGFLRFTWPLFPGASEFFSPGVVTLSLLAVVYGGLTTCRQVDLKRLIAYSSVSHMGLVTLSLFSLTSKGLQSAVFLMISHGLVSSALFICAGILYTRHQSRLIVDFRGLVSSMPLFSFLFLALLLANSGLPCSSSFVGEFLALLSVFEYSRFVALLAAFGSVLSAAYSVFLFNRVCFGAPSPYLRFPRDLDRLEFYTLAPLVFLTFFLGLFPRVIFDTLRSR